MLLPILSCLNSKPHYTTRCVFERMRSTNNSSTEACSTKIMQILFYLFYCKYDWWAKRCCRFKFSSFLLCVLVSTILGWLIRQSTSMQYVRCVVKNLKLTCYAWVFSLNTARIKWQFVYWSRNFVKIKSNNWSTCLYISM